MCNPPTPCNSKAFLPEEYAVLHPEGWAGGRMGLFVRAIPSRHSRLARLGRRLGRSYHANENLAPGGFLGVDVFFVISGFLITSILLEDIRHETFSYARFYRNRVRRIFPALFVMLGCVTLFACAVLSPFYQIEFGRTLMATAVFASNFEFEHLSGYFDEAAALKPLLHTWSLGVEEQFYLFFPLFLVFAWRHAKRHLSLIFVVCGCISLAAYLWLKDTRSPNAAFFFTFSRIFELMIGAVLALHRTPAMGRTARALLSMAGATAILACTFLPRLPYLDVSPILVCLGTTALIAANASGPTLIGNLLSQSPVTFIGAISYSLYLWHWPILSLMKSYLLRPLTALETIAAIFTALILAILSWRFVEKPVSSKPLDRKGVWLAVIASVIALATGATLVLGKGFPERFSVVSNQLFAYRNDISPWRNRCHGDIDKSIPYDKNCVFGASKAGNATVAVWADSFGAELAPALGEVQLEHRIMQITYSSCPPAQGFMETAGCVTHNRETLAGLLQDRDIRTIILFARYAAYPNPWPGLEQSIASLSRAGKRVILIYPLPEFFVTAPDATGMLQARGTPPGNYRMPLAEFHAENSVAVRKLDELASRYHLSRLVPDNLFCGSEGCAAYDGHDVLYFDSYHLSMSGARKLATVLKRFL